MLSDWGIPDALFVAGDEAVGDAVGTVAFFPILVLAARVCPKVLCCWLRLSHQLILGSLHMSCE
jgi:hypothetical protein